MSCEQAQSSFFSYYINNIDIIKRNPCGFGLATKKSYSIVWLLKFHLIKLLHSVKMVKCDFLYFASEGYFGQDIITVIQGLVMLVPIPGNLLTLFVIQKCWQIKDEPTYLLVKSMCIADLLDSSVTQPLYIATLLNSTRYSCVLDNFLCVSCWVANVTSACSMTCIVIESFIYIQYPFRFQTIVTKRRTLVIVCVIWGVGVFFGVSLVFFVRYLVLYMLPHCFCSW